MGETYILCSIGGVNNLHDGRIVYAHSASIRPCIDKKAGRTACCSRASGCTRHQAHSSTHTSHYCATPLSRLEDMTTTQTDYLQRSMPELRAAGE